MNIVTFILGVILGVLITAAWELEGLQAFCVGVVSVMLTGIYNSKDPWE